MFLFFAHASTRLNFRTTQRTHDFSFSPKKVNKVGDELSGSLLPLVEDLVSLVVHLVHQFGSSLFHVVNFLLELNALLLNKRAKHKHQMFPFRIDILGGPLCRPRRLHLFSQHHMMEYFRIWKLMNSWNWASCTTMWVWCPFDVWTGKQLPSSEKCFNQLNLALKFPELEFVRVYFSCQFF